MEKASIEGIQSAPFFNAFSVVTKYAVLNDAVNEALTSQLVYAPLANFFTLGLYSFMSDDYQWSEGVLSDANTQNS